MRIETTVTVWREEGHFLAHAMPLDVMSSGPTPEAARAAVAAAVRVFVEAATEHGTLDAVLEECGYKRQGEEWVSPEWVATERIALSA
jgi:predicted RNase H-like HicB family nuclease